MKFNFKYISKESAPVSTEMTQDTIRKTIEDIVKAIMPNIVEFNFNMRFADIGFVPDQYNEMIGKVNTAFGINIHPSENIQTPEELVNIVVGQVIQPTVAEEAFDFSVFTGYINEVEELQKQLDLMTDTSVEGLGTMLTKALVSAGDIFVRMGNSFKTSITRFNCAVKRSEIKMYYESNMLKVSQVEKASYDLFKDREVDKPVGMVGTFKEAVDAVNKAYTVLDFYAFAAAVEKHLKDMRLIVARDSKNFSQLNTILQVIKTREKLLEEEKLAINKIFTDKQTETIGDFSELYKDMDEFKYVRETLTSMMSRIDESTRLSACVDDCDSALQDIISLVEQDTQIDKAFISNLLEITKYMSEACSFYGENVSRQMALEHNHVLNIAACWQEIR